MIVLHVPEGENPIRLLLKVCQDFTRVSRIGINKKNILKCMEDSKSSGNRVFVLEGNETEPKVRFKIGINKKGAYLEWIRIPRHNYNFPGTNSAIKGETYMLI